MLVGIVAHVNREHLVDGLIRDSQADIIRFDDTFPPSAKGCANNHIRVLTDLRKHARKDEWVIVLEDDAMPVDDFRKQAELALAQSDSELVGLYLGTSNPGGVIQQAVEPAVINAEAVDSNWVVADWFVSGPGYAVRSDVLGSLIDSLGESKGPVDVRVNEWARYEGIETWYTYPSLINHNDAQSLINSYPDFARIMPRRAWRAGGRAEWSSSTTKMDHVDAQAWW